MMHIPPEDRPEARRLIALAALWQALAAAREKDFISWRSMGGPEAEALLLAIQTGGDDPALRRWQEMRATVTANRPVPNPLDLEARHLVLQMVEALRRAGLGKGMARKRAAEAVDPIFPTTPAAIRGWHSDYPAFAPPDERRIAAAISRYGHDYQQIVNWFIGLIRVQIDPVTIQSAWFIPPDG